MRDLESGSELDVALKTTFWPVYGLEGEYAKAAAGGLSVITIVVTALFVVRPALSVALM